MKIHKPFGVDLGTTNSTAAIFENGEITCAEESKRNTIPSLVCLEKKKIKVGSWVKNHPEKKEVIKSIKKKMGKSNPVVLGDKEYLPEDISSFILKHCADLLNKQVKKPDNIIYDRAVITVPAYFSIASKDATRKAGELAGLDVVQLLEEPTSAAINYTLKNNIDNGLFMVYDLGGGTFDVSIVEKCENIPIVHATSGNNNLGGDNFDHILANYFIDYLNNELGYEVKLDKSKPEDDRKFKCLLLAAENVKKNLTASDSYSIMFYDVFKDNSCVDLVIEDFSRDKFNELIKDKIEKDTIAECEKAIKKYVSLSEDDDNKRSASDIDKIILVGGSTHIPLVKEVLKKKYVDNKIISEIDTVDPDLSVGYGASIVAATMSTIIEDDENNLIVEIEAPHQFDSDINIAGKVLKGKLDKLVIATGKKQYETEIDNSEFSVDVQKVKKDMVYKFYNNDKLLLEVSEKPQKNDLIAPTPIQNETIRIEIVDLEKKQIVDYPLVEKNEPLPCTSTHDFVLNEFSKDRIILPIKEGYRESYRLIIDPPSSAKIGSKISVTVEIDTLSNVDVTVTLDGKKIDGKKVFPNVSEIDADDRHVKNEFDEKIKNVKYEERDKFYEQKENIERELKEAEQNQDKVHYADVVNKYEGLVRDLPDSMSGLTDKDFDDLEEEIKDIDKNNELNLDYIEENVYFGKRALSKEDYRQAQERYDTLCDIKSQISMQQDKKVWCGLICMAATRLVDEARNINPALIDSELYDSIQSEVVMLNNYFAEFGNKDLDSMTDDDFDQLAYEVRNKVARLASLMSETNIEGIDEKVREFEGKISKA